jgi:exopolyphosphatase / guanosine-5'-triphosphate,3'-diphosphate pyrophosphatase
MPDDGTGTVAALDCGTNSTRLLIVDADDRVLERRMIITRLGEGVDATRKLAPDAITRTVAVLGQYRRLMDFHRVERSRLVATSATRDAVNAEEFFESAERVTGVRPELLTGLAEGELSFAGATARLPTDRPVAGPVLVVDIGGGSTEIVVGDPRDAGDATRAGRRGTVAAVSLDIGCVRLSERFFHHDPPLADELDAAAAVVEAEVTRARSQLPPVAPGGTLIGLAGTVSTLAALVGEIDVYDRGRIHHAVLTAEQVAGWFERLATEDRRARLVRPGMVEGRADVIVGGIMVLASVMNGFQRTECLVSEDDILDGLVASLR